MTSNLFVLRDFVERGFMAFDIPYHYLSGEVMEAEIPPTLQPLFSQNKTMKLCFNDAPLIDPTIERVGHGALVLDALGRLLEGDRNTVGHALIARNIDLGQGVPEHKDRLHVLNATISNSIITRVYRPIIRLEFRIRAITRNAIRSQSVPVFYDVESSRVMEGGRFANLQLQDVEEIFTSGETIGLKTPPADKLSESAEAAVTYLKRSLPPLEEGPYGGPPEVDIRLVRLLVLHDPRAGALVTFKERSTKREFNIAFPVAEDASRIAIPFCSDCGRIKTHFYISHETGKLICTDCSLLCVGCWNAYSLESKNCDICTKRRYCPSCMSTCEGCGTTVCPDHGKKNEATGMVYCEACAPGLIEEETAEAEPAEADTSDTLETPDTSGDQDWGEILSDSEDDSKETDLHEEMPEVDQLDSYGEESEDDIFSTGADSPSEDLTADIPEDLTEFDTPEPWGEEPSDSCSDSSEDEEPDAEAPVERSVEEAEETSKEFEIPESELPYPNLEPGRPDPTAGETTEERDIQPGEAPAVDTAAGEEYEDAEASKTVKCTCHGQPSPPEKLRVDFLSGQYYCPDQVEPCSLCQQATALDFLNGDPPLCFYCSNRNPLNLDPEAEEIFRREIQPILPMKYRFSSCKIARSPHHLAYYIKPLVGREILLYWDQWTNTVLDDNQFT